MTGADQAAPAGGTRRLSPHTTMAVAIAAALSRLGVPLEHAAHAGMTFGHTQIGSPRRPAPGMTYTGSVLTIIAIDPAGTTMRFIRIFPAGHATATISCRDRRHRLRPAARQPIFRNNNAALVAPKYFRLAPSFEAGGRQQRQAALRGCEAPRVRGPTTSRRREVSNELVLDGQGRHAGAYSLGLR